MRLEEVEKIVGDLPYMSLKQASTLSDIIKQNNCQRILELGFFHGVSTCYMASILDEMSHSGTSNKGHIVTIDLCSAKTREPNIEELLGKSSLNKYVSVFYEPKSYNWRLMKFIEEGRKFDFCYLDGGHNWYDTGYAFFLVDKILEPGGLILFDDLYWTAEKHEWSKKWPDEERTTQGVLKVWDLLVLQHPLYEKAWVKNSWGLARKLPLPNKIKSDTMHRAKQNVIWPTSGANQSKILPEGWRKAISVNGIRRLIRFQPASKKQ